MVDYLYRSACWQAEAIRRGELSSQELVRSSLERIEAVNPRLNAVVQVTADHAMEEARQADEMRKRGKLRGPLHGVPMTIKDSLDTAGVITTWGTTGQRRRIPIEDATVVSRLKEAGAILLGKTNTPELTLSFATENRVYGRTNNPHDIDRSPGGSSGGAAAIVASGGSSLDIGSDTGGSIRLPAHFCGVSGIRPTSGRVPRTGHAIPPGGLLDTLTQLGPLARYVEDLELVLSIIAGPDGKDSWIQPMPLEGMEGVRLAGRRAAFFVDNGFSLPSADVIQAVLEVASLLSDAGVAVEECRPPAAEESFKVFNGLLTSWAFPWARRLLARAGTPASEVCIEGLNEVRVVGWDDLIGYIDRWESLRTQMLDFFASYDLILSPVCAFPAYLHGTHSDDDKGFSYTTAISLTGWPVVVVPVGRTQEDLPVGVQIIARPWREEMALAAASQVEGAIGGWRRPPLWA
jgi:amidase